MTNHSNTAIPKKDILSKLGYDKFSLQEKRFFRVFVSKLNPLYGSTQTIHFSISGFQEIMDLKKLEIEQFKAVTDSFLTKLVHLPNENGKGYISFQLFKECTVSQDKFGEWYVEVSIDSKVLPLVFDFQNYYFKRAIQHEKGEIL